MMKFKIVPNRKPDTDVLQKEFIAIAVERTLSAPTRI